MNIYNIAKLSDISVCQTNLLRGLNDKRSKKCKKKPVFNFTILEGWVLLNNSLYEAHYSAVLLIIIAQSLGLIYGAVPPSPFPLTLRSFHHQLANVTGNYISKSQGASTRTVLVLLKRNQTNVIFVESQATIEFPNLINVIN